MSSLVGLLFLNPLLGAVVGGVCVAVLGGFFNCQEHSRCRRGSPGW